MNYRFSFIIELCIREQCLQERSISLEQMKDTIESWIVYWLNPKQSVDDVIHMDQIGWHMSQPHWREANPLQLLVQKILLGFEAISFFLSLAHLSILTHLTNTYSSFKVWKGGRAEE